MNLNRDTKESSGDEDENNVDATNEVLDKDNCKKQILDLNLS